jgi:hypothetical protein
MVKDINKNMHFQMKNPYFEIFFKILENKEIIDSNGCNGIYILDLIAILCRFLDFNELLETLQNLVNSGIRTGNLEVLPLIGLNSPEKVFVLLQMYVDNTSDIQTAAYIAAYAINV